ncbi:MAG: glycosyltransferase family 39 protein [Proteobacteria bacterium]|nr:glycosyltransferase family 39 protein [Pseudomonadota bacterium]
MKITPLHLAILAGFAISAFVVDLGGYGILDNNEGLYASIAAEMRAGGDWIIPHLDAIAYIEKPPMLFWLTGASFALFGPTEAAARAAPALASLAVVATALWLGWRTGRAAAGWVAGLIIATSIVTIGIGRTLYFDMLHTAFVSAALALAFVGLRDRRTGPIRIAAALLALAVLTKGFLGFGLCGIVLAAFLLATRAPLGDWRRLLDPVAILVFLAIAAPWHVAALLRHEAFGWFYFVNEHVGRLLGTREPADFYRGSFWYYLPRLFAYAAPWTLLLPVVALRRARSSTEEPADRLPAFLWSWLLGALFLFSVAGNKANYYMIAAIVPLALLLGRHVAVWLEVGRSRHLWGIAGAMLVLSISALVIVDTECGPRLGQLYPFCEDLVPAAYIPFGVVILLSAGIGFAVRARTWRPIIPLLAIASFAVPMRGLVVEALRHNEAAVSQRGLVRQFAERDDGRPIYVFGKLSDISSFGFYVGRPFDMLESVDPEFHFPRRRPEAAGRFLSFRQLDDRARREPVYVISENWRVPAVQPDRTFLPYCVMLRTRNVSVLSNIQSDCPKP